MRKRLVDSYTDPDTGITFGLRGSPVDFSLSQDYTHDHVRQVTRDLLMKNAPALVEGFDYTLAGNLSISVAAGRGYDAAGEFYETITDPPGGPTVVTLDPADPALPRIDLVYVQLETAVPAVPLTRYFRRLPTEAEAAAGTRYSAQPIERNAEEHTRATVRVRKGTPGAVPAAPALAAHEAALYQVRVNANAGTLVAGNVTDVRAKVRSLYDALVLIDANTAALQPASLNETIDDRVSDLLADSTYLTKVYGDEPADLLTLDVDLAALYTPLDARYAALATFTEAVQDALSGFFPDASPFDWTYDDANNRVQLDIAVATAALKGLLSAADKAMLDAATSAATANTLAKRDANGDVTHRRVISNVATGTQPLGVTSTTEVTNLNVNYLQGQALSNLDNRYQRSGFRTTNAQTVTMLTTDYWLELTGNAHTCTLPDASAMTGKDIIITCTAGGQLVPFSGQNIDGAGSFATAIGGKYRFGSTGSAWKRINN